jgi:hypothetical protein
VESQSAIKDEATQHDRSPLEAQREWRPEAENNVLNALQRDGFLAPPRDIDKLLNTIVNNLEVTNNLSGQVDLQPGNKDQLEVLPLGARVKLDPYSDRLTLLKTRPAAPNSAREKMPFEVTLLVPYLTSYADTTAAQASFQSPIEQCR